MANRLMKVAGAFAVVASIGSMTGVPCALAEGVAANGQRADQLVENESIEIGSLDAPDTDAYEAYADRCFAKALEGEDLEAQALSDWKLDELTGKVYRLLRPMIAQVAAGERVSTVFEISAQDLYGKDTFTASDLGLSSIYYSGSHVTRFEADEAVRDLFRFDSGLLQSVLQLDAPYDTYWATLGMRIEYPSISAVHQGSGYYRIDSPLRISMYVSNDYAQSDFAVNPVYGTRVKNAVNYAKNISATGAKMNVYDRLNYYKDTICANTDYDRDAGDGTKKRGNPNNIINVFDRDPSTGVVSEGYAKSFKYLCDLSGAADVSCLVMQGTLHVVLQDFGGHYWNIVKMPNGRNYMVDIAMCDSGWPTFFLLPTSGNWK